MFNRLSQNSKSYLQLILMIVISVITQVILLLRTSFIAESFGTGIQLDAFNFSNSIGTFIFSFIGAGMTTVLIPSLVNNKTFKSINSFINILYSSAFVILLIVYFSRIKIIEILSPGNQEFIKIASSLMLITLITQFINSFTGATNAIYQCHGNYNCPKIINLLTGILLIVLLAITSNIDIYNYAFLIFITTVINIFLQVILLPKKGYRYKYVLDIRDNEFRNMLRIFFPTVLSTGLYQLSLIIDTLIASNLGDGNISILTYSNTIMNMLNTVLLTNIMMYFYPKIAKDIHNENSQTKLFDLAIILTAIMCLIFVGFYVIGEDGIVLLYERGKFTHETTQIVYDCTIIYMISLPLNAVRDLIYRYFYAKGDTLSPFKNSLMISVLNMIISIYLSHHLGLSGIILGTVITSLFSLIMISYRFNKIFTLKYNRKLLFYEVSKILITSGLIILIYTLLKPILPCYSEVSNILLYGGAVLFSYIFLLLVLKSRIFKIRL